MKPVPFKRPLAKGAEGADVRALQRALAKAGCRRIGPSGKYGATTVANVRYFQARAGIRSQPGAPRGVVKENTWRHLQPYFDGFDHYLVEHYTPPKPVVDKIDKFVKTAWWAYAQRPLRYVQARPMDGMQPPPNVNRYLDCSEFVTWCARAAGLPDPGGFGYDGYGSTYSFLDHMPRTSSPRRGDLSFYDGPSHVAIMVYDDAMHGRMVLSMGSDLGPRLLYESYRRPVAHTTFRGLK